MLNNRFLTIVLSSISILYNRSIKFHLSKIHRQRKMFSKKVDFNEMLTEVYASSPTNVFSATVTGGGVQLLQWLFTVPGASKSLMEATVPYSTAALNQQILSNTKNLQYCSSEMAIKMAEQCRKRTAELLFRNSGKINVLTQSNIFSISCTAALVSSQPKRGDHRFYVASSNNENNLVYNVKLLKGHGSRIDEDLICSKVALEAIRHNSNLNNKV